MSIELDEVTYSTEEEGEEENKDKIQLIPEIENTLPPKDKYHLIYFAFILLAIGLLFPYNSFIVGIDYFHYLYPNDRAEFLIPLVYLLVTFAFVLFNITIVNLVSVHYRIAFGYLLFVISLSVVPLLDIGINNCTINSDIGFSLTLVATMIVGVGSGIQQTSLYGLAGMLPPRYTQALMLGEAFSGSIATISRIITKASSIGSERSGAIIFFILSLVFVIFCAGCHIFFVQRSSFMKYYTAKNSFKKGGEKKKFTAWKRSVLKSIDSFSISTNVASLKGGLIIRFKIIKKVWQPVLAVFLIFLVTLWVFPGLPSDVQDCRISDWAPVVLIGIFTVSDTISRICALIPIRWNSKLFILISVTRLILVPVMVLCVSPSPTHPIISSPLIIASITILMIGLSNGYFGTLSMQYPPTMVNDSERELTGNMTALFLLGGLTAGSLLANIWTPLISLAPYIPCTNETAQFHCLNNNATNIY